MKEHLEPRDVDFLSARFDAAGSTPILVAAPFLSARTQERLKAGGFAFADLTGNIYLNVPEPGLFVQTSGAAENPFSARRDRKSLRGAKAGRLIRALCDFRPPTGLRELAKRAGIDAGYASRLIDFLDREALVRRDKRGAIIHSEWGALIRRWSQSYSPFKDRRVVWFLAPRGLSQIPGRLKELSMRYAMSASWAAAQLAPVSPTRLIFCYTDEPDALARALDIRPAETGANVALAMPFDPVVYERTSDRNGVTITAASQIATDLFSSPGRGPSEAEALIVWMQSHEDVWRH